MDDLIPLYSTIQHSLDFEFIVFFSYDIDMLKIEFAIDKTNPTSFRFLKSIYDLINSSKIDKGSLPFISYIIDESMTNFKIYRYYISDNVKISKDEHIKRLKSFINIIESYSKNI